MSYTLHLVPICMRFDKVTDCASPVLQLQNAILYEPDSCEDEEVRFICYFQKNYTRHANIQL